MEGLLFRVLILLGCLHGFVIGGICPRLDDEYRNMCNCLDIRPVQDSNLVQVSCRKTSDAANDMRKSGDYSKNKLYLSLVSLNMTVIPENYFNGFYIRIMSIERTPIRKIGLNAFNGSEYILSTLVLKYTDIREIPNMVNHHRLETVRIHGAKKFKAEIGPEDISNLPVNVIRYLDLTQLNIEIIKPKTFESLKKIFSLKLENNKISSLPGDVFPSNLHTLNLRKNKLTAIPIDSILRMSPGSSVELENNAIKNLEENDVMATTTQLIELTIEHKNFECSCAMAWVPGYFKEHGTSYLKIYNARCKGDNERNGNLVARMKPELFDDCN